MQKLVWQNAKGDEIDLTSGHYGITEWEGFSGVDLNIQSQQVPFQDGSVFLDGLLSERELSVTLAINDGKDLKTRYQLRRELIHILNPKLGEGYLIYTNDFISKRIKCIPQIPLFPTHNSNKAGTPKASLAWTACNPYWEDLEETVVKVNLGEGKEIINNGDVPTQLKIKFLGNAQNPEIVNYTTNQKIKITTELSLPVDIETFNGGKKIYEETLDFVIELLGCTIIDMEFVNDKVVLLCDNGTTLVYDGNSVHSLLVEGNAVKYSENLHLCIICCNGGVIYKSSNLKDWEKQTISNVNLNDVDVYNNKIRIVGNNGTILSSSDGNSWTSETSGTNENLNAISDSGANCVAVGDNGTILEYSLGVWNVRTSGTTEKLNDVLKVGLVYYIVGNNGIFINGSFTDWDIRDIGTTENLYSLFRKGDYAYFLGDNGTVIKFDLSYEYSSSGGTVALDIPTTNSVRAGGFSVKQDQYFYGGQGFLFGGFSDTDFNVILQGEVNDFNDIINIEGIIYCVGNNGILYKKENSKFEKIEINTQKNLLSIIYVQNKGFTIVGDDIVIKSQNGRDWIIDDETFENTHLTDITYSSKDDNYYITGYDDNSGYIFQTPDFENINVVYSYGNARPSHIEYSDDLDMFCIGGDTFCSGFLIGCTKDFQDIKGIDYSLRKVCDLKYIKSQKKFYITTTGISYGLVINDYYKTDGSVDERFGDLIVEEGGWSLLYSGSRVGGFCYNEFKGIVVGTSSVEVLYGADFNSTNSIKGMGGGIKTGIVDKNDNFILIGEKGLIESSRTIESTEKELISKLTLDSDMNMNLEVGSNNIRLFKDAGEFFAIISFRQKYIGV